MVLHLSGQRFASKPVLVSVQPVHVIALGAHAIIVEGLRLDLSVKVRAVVQIAPALARYENRCKPDLTFRHFPPD